MGDELPVGVGVAVLLGVGAPVGVPVGVTVGVLAGVGEPLGVADEVGVGVGVPEAAGAGVAVAARTVLVTEDAHLTVAPPPLPELLHWSMVTGSAAAWVEGSTVHWTRIVPPPPLPEPLHWVMVALLVLPMGLQETVGSVPPPVPEPLHWLIVAAAVEVAPVMLLVIRELHLTLPPPPLPEPLHRVIEVTRSAEDEVAVVHGRTVLAAPWHSRTVVVELVTPVARSRLLVTVTSHSTPCPPALSDPLHTFTAIGAAWAGARVRTCQLTTASTATRNDVTQRVVQRSNLSGGIP
ncbi:MAG TPA: hypothetical protein VNB94_12225 [Mycobacteriales bacterium]|nr:hypothetical protein [Mycobacteriales bacterium]